MKNLVIGDLHFGTKSNSQQWLQYQINYFEKQIFNIVQDDKFDRIIFLGDLTDIRWAINQQIGCELKKLIRKLSTIYRETNPNGKIIFIAGNHDYFSPLEEFHKYNSYETIFGKEFTKVYDNIIFVNNEPLFDEENDESLYLPWFYTENPDNFASILYDYKHPNVIYCHDDLSAWDISRIASIRGAKVYSGHIHFGWEDKDNNLYNLSAAMSFNFNDINQKRYIYIIENGKLIDKIQNVTTPVFKRLFNEEIFNELDNTFFENSFVQLMINKSNINKAEYIERLKEIKTKYSELYSISIKLYDNLHEFEKMEFSPIQTNINEYIGNNVPEHLTDKYNIIRDLLTNDNQEY